MLRITLFTALHSTVMHPEQLMFCNMCDTSERLRCGSDAALRRATGHAAFAHPREMLQLDNQMTNPVGVSALS